MLNNIFIIYYALCAIGGFILLPLFVCYQMVLYIMEAIQMGKYIYAPLPFVTILFILIAVTAVLYPLKSAIWIAYIKYGGMK